VFSKNKASWEKTIKRFKFSEPQFVSTLKEADAG
jgi:hypothetical protein